MLRLDTQFEIQNVATPKLFKVITPEEFVSKGTASCAGEASFDDLMLWLDESSTGNLEQWLSVPVGGFLLPRNSHEFNHISAVQLTNPKDPLVVQPGDVIVVSPGSNVERVL